MTPPAPRWTLFDFGERLDLWIAMDHPADDERLIVTTWVMNRHTDPYKGMRREPGFDQLWFGPVPDTYDERGSAVCCSYWIYEQDRTVWCNQFARLGLPF